MAHFDTPACMMFTAESVIESGEIPEMMNGLPVVMTSAAAPNAIAPTMRRSPNVFT